MNYPLISEYIEAIRYAEDNFATLTNLRPELDDNGNPIMSSGNFAVVFKMKDVNTGKFHALKCFTREQEDRAFAYKLISEELQGVHSPYIVNVRYLENELFVDSSLSDETDYPVLLMDWVEGQTLTSFLQEIQSYCTSYDFVSFSSKEEQEAYDDLCSPYELNCLPYNFLRMASWLLKQPFAHGDIKPDNIIITPEGTCVLVDYDGMFVPAMQGMKVGGMGTPNFRHPSASEYSFDKSIDSYSISVIALSLCAYAINSFLLVDCEDFCLISERESSKLWGHFIFQDEELMVDALFKELLSIYLHTLNQNRLDSDYFDRVIAEYLCPSNYDISNTEVTEYDEEHFWEDEYGVRYSLDGRRVIKATKKLEGIDYKIREGVLTICDQAFQGKGLHGITLPDSVITIGGVAFANNDDMEYCNIPSTVKYICDNNPWGGCFNIRRLDCSSPYYLIKDGILYSYDYKIIYGLIYWHQDIVIDYRTKQISANAFWSSKYKSDNYIRNIDLCNVSIIGNSAFFNCESASFDITESIGVLKDCAFFNCQLLERIDLSKIETIPNHAFVRCENLKEVILSSRLKRVSTGSFISCKSLKTISIPSTVTYISEDAFYDCTALSEIIVAEDNKDYCSIDGVLFNRNVTKLIIYPAAKKDKIYEIPKSVCEISDKAFARNPFIEEVMGNNRLSHFGKNVFEKCESLRKCSINLTDDVDRDSAWNLGSLLLDLKDATKESKKYGFDLICKSASMNQADSQWKLANCYKYGRYCEINTAKYIYWLEESATNMNFQAMSRLGTELIMGKNITQDYKRAYQLLSNVEKYQGALVCKGMHFVPLGFLYERGLWVKKDLKKAVEYYMKGAKWKDPRAQFYLGRCYENGIGVEVDLVKAKEHYSLANGHSLSSKALERVEKLLNNKVGDDLPF